LDYERFIYHVSRRCFETLLCPKFGYRQRCRLCPTHRRSYQMGLHLTKSNSDYFYEPHFQDLKRLASMPIDVEHDILNRQIITGWIFPNNNLTVQQLHLSSLQKCSDLRKMYFYHDNDAAVVQDILNIANSIVDGNDVPKVETTADNNSFTAFLLPLQIYLDSREVGPKKYYGVISMTFGVSSLR
jgi:hypothetical protein